MSCAAARRQRRAAQLLLQAAAAAELQREERPALVLADLVDLDDVGVLQARDRFRLRPEARQFRGAGVAARQDHLQRYHPVRLDLPRPVHHPHAAAAQLTQQLIAGDRDDGRRFDQRPGVRGERRGGGQQRRAVQRRRFSCRWRRRRAGGGFGRGVGRARWSCHRDSLGLHGGEQEPHGRGLYRRERRKTTNSPAFLRASYLFAC